MVGGASKLPLDSTVFSLWQMVCLNPAASAFSAQLVLLELSARVRNSSALSLTSSSSDGHVGQD